MAEGPARFEAALAATGARGRPRRHAGWRGGRDGGVVVRQRKGDAVTYRGDQPGHNLQQLVDEMETRVFGHPRDQVREDAVADQDEAGRAEGAQDGEPASAFELDLDPEQQGAADAAAANPD